MNRDLLIRFMAAGLTVSLYGCHAKAPVTYQPQLAPDAISPGLPPPENGYRLLVEPQTRDVFPCTVAIARLEPDEPNGNDFVLAQTPETGRSVRFSAAELRPTEQAFWAETFRGMLAVRDLRFLGPRSVRDRGDGVAELLHAALRVDASFLLTYVVNRYGPNSAQVIGALYDVKNAQPVAVLQTHRQYVDDEGHEVAPEEKPGDQRAVDAVYQAQRHFESLTLSCVRDLLRGDQPAQQKRPHRWKPPYPPWCPFWPAPPGMIPPP